MPYKSLKQERYFNANRSKLEAQGVDVDEWNKASKGSFSNAAKQAGKPTRDLAEEDKHKSGKTGQRARRALGFMGSKK